MELIAFQIQVSYVVQENLYVSLMNSGLGALLFHEADVFLWGALITVRYVLFLYSGGFAQVGRQSPEH